MHKHLPKFNDYSYTHFVTAKTYENRYYFENDELCQILLEEIKFYSEKYGFAIVGYVIMPDHLHLLVWWDNMENQDLSISKIMQGIKGATARRIIDLMEIKGLEHLLQSTRRKFQSESHRRNLKYIIWQPGFYDFNIYSEEKLLEKLDYMHNNPASAGMVLAPGDYKWSSYRQYFAEEKAFQGVA